MAGILKVGDVKNGYEVYKMVSGEDQGGYSITAFAKKDGFNYFMKMYQTPTVVSTEEHQEYFKNRIFKLMGKLGISKIKNFIAQDKEFFLDEDTGRYIKISELLTGTQLSKLLSSEPYNNAGLPIDEAMKYATLIAYAFKNIHEFGITHSDLKPDNIFIEERETISGKVTKSVVIIDFDSAVIDDLPRPRELVGTPGYYSVEHLIHDYMDESVWPSTDSDVFTIGIIFYELLVGQKPFVGKGEDGSLHETAMVICNEEKMPAPPNELVEGIPQIVSDIILKMLSPVRTERPTMQDVHGVFIEASSGEAVESKFSKPEEKEEITEAVTKDAPADTPDTIEETPATTDKAAEGSTVSSGELKITGPEGEKIISKNEGIPQINAKFLGEIGINVKINAGRIYYNSGSNCWMIYTSKHAGNNLVLNNVELSPEMSVELKTNDELVIGGVKTIITSSGESIDSDKLKKETEKMRSDKIMAEKTGGGAVPDTITLVCGDKEIKISAVSTFMLSNRNLMDFDLYSIKNLGTISLDMGHWKIYPSKFSKGVLKLNGADIEHPTPIAGGDIIGINDKQIEVRF